jgi:hypothetical protein
MRIAELRDLEDEGMRLCEDELTDPGIAAWIAACVNDLQLRLRELPDPGIAAWIAGDLQLCVKDLQLRLREHAGIAAGLRENRLDARRRLRAHYDRVLLNLQLFRS